MRSAKRTNKAMATFCLTEETVEGTGFADIAGLDCEPFVLC